MTDPWTQTGRAPLALLTIVAGTRNNHAGVFDSAGSLAPDGPRSPIRKDLHGAKWHIWVFIEQ